MHTLSDTVKAWESFNTANKNKIAIDISYSNHETTSKQRRTLHRIHGIFVELKNLQIKMKQLHSSLKDEADFVRC